MSDFEDDITFDGINGIKCESFVRFIRRRVLTNGTQRDDQLIAETAAACFDGPALRWYEDLDSDTQESWKLLRRALLTRWEDSGSADSGPVPFSVPAAHIPAPAPAASLPAEGMSTNLTPAAAPPSQPTSVQSNPLIGRIRVVAADSDTPLGYISRTPNPNGNSTTTHNIDDALIVRFLPSGELTELFVLTPSSPNVPEMLGITFRLRKGQTPEELRDTLHQGVVTWGSLAWLSGPNVTALATTSVSYTGLRKSAVWHILIDGEMLICYKLRSSSYCRFEIAVGDKTGSITITTSQADLLKENPNWSGNKGRFFFEKI